MSPKTKLLILALFIAVVLTFLFDLAEIPFGWGLARGTFVVVVAVLLYVLLERIASKLRHIRHVSQERQTEAEQID